MLREVKIEAESPPGKRTGLIAPLLLAMVLAITAAGCGGGGGSGTPYTLGGTISIPAGITIDWDVNDPNDNKPYDNNTLADAQPIPNPIRVGGYLNAAGTGPPGRSYLHGDENDYYLVTLNDGDRVFLAIGDDSAGDLDLYLYDTGGNDIGGTLLGFSIGTGPSETLVPPESGTYIVNVHAAEGASNYILIIGPHTGEPAHGALSSDHDVVAGQAIVQFADNFPAASMRALADRADSLGMTLDAGGPGRAALATFDTPSRQETAKRALSIPDHNRPEAKIGENLQRKLDTARVIKALRKRPDVLWADTNDVLRHFGFTPDDPDYPKQWHYPLINLPLAWDLTTGSDAVIVAVIDTGVLMGHPDLQGQLTHTGYDFIRDPISSGDGTGGIDPDPDDPGDGLFDGASSFHGTHVAGTVAAATDNSIGVAGVGRDTKIMPIRALGKNGSGTWYDIEQSLLYAAGEPNDSGTVPPQSADIINLSLGGGGYSQRIQNLFNRIREKGIIVVAAAGNESTSNPSYPASYEGVISVSAVNHLKALASYSNYGRYIDLAAPGGDAEKGVWSTCGDDTTGTIQFNYRAYMGTSMATPHVAGVAALMKAERPDLTPDLFNAYLNNGLITTDLGPTGWDNRYGWGLIDAYKAVRTARDASMYTPLSVDKTALGFGVSATHETLTVSKISDDPVSISSFTAGAAWLQVDPAAVDEDGWGTYVVTVDRENSGLSEGKFSSSITFTPDSGIPLSVPVYLQMITNADSSNAGFHYVLLMDAGTYEIIQQVDVPASEGRYDYSFTGVRPGTYWIFAGSDRDNDGYIDNPGESYGAFGSLTHVTTVTVDRNRTDLDFTTDLRLELPAAIHFDGASGYLPVLQRLR
jgi:serine protease